MTKSISSDVDGLPGIGRRLSSLLGGWLSQILVAVVLVAIAFTVRFALGLIWEQVLLFAVCYPAILLATLVAGLRSGLIALALSVLIFWWAFVPPIYSFALVRPVDAVNISLFVVAAAVLVWIAHLYRRGQEELEQQKATLSERDQRLKLALSAGRGVGTWDWDVQSDRVVADAQFARLYGVDPKKAAEGAPIAEFSAPYIRAISAGCRRG